MWLTLRDKICQPHFYRLITTNSQVSHLSVSDLLSNKDKRKCHGAIDKHLSEEQFGKSDMIIFVI